MRRLALLLVVTFAAAAPGCATNPSGQQGCHTDFLGNCQQADPFSAALGLGAAAVGAGVLHAVSAASRADRQGEDPPARALTGQLRWWDSATSRPPLPVTLRRAEEATLQQTVTDRWGRFEFPFPRRPGWYTVAVTGGGAEGEATLWLQDRPPPTLELHVQPRSVQSLRTR